MPRVRMLFIGGSNTVMETGYTRDFVRCLSDGLGETVEYETIAVGGSPCTFGLQRLLAREDLDFDLFVVEYMANDFSLGADEASLRTWRAAYEGILRVLRRRRPRAHILSVLLGRRSAKDDERLGRMSAEIEALSEHYGGVTADVHGFLRERAPDAETRERMFRDNAHYTEPFMTALVGYVAASAILPHLLRPAAPAPLPEPAGPVTFEHASVVSLTDLEPDPGAPMTFENTRYRVDAVRLAPGDDPREILLPGALISLGFVSTPDAGRLLIEEAGCKAVTTDTLTLRVAEGGYPFLLKSVNFPLRDWGPSDARPRTARLRALAPDEPGPDGAEHLARFNMIPPASAEPAVYLTDALCFRTG